MVPIVLGVTIIVFFMIRLVPGDPAVTILGVHATPERVAALHKQWGTNHSLPYQYELFMKRLAHGSLGSSLIYDVPVRQLVLDRLGPTLWLLVLSTIFSLLI